MESTKKHKTATKMIYVYSDLCSGCGYCQLACSFAKTGTFGSGNSRISIRRAEGKELYRVGFLEDCDHCGFCAKYCFFGVLSDAKREVKRK